MPTYDYRCNDCDFEFETVQKITEQSLKNCPQCNQETLHRIPGGGIGLSFKGTGFYCTDYGSKKTDSPKESSSKSDCCPCGNKSPRS